MIEGHTPLRKRERQEYAHGVKRDQVMDAALEYHDQGNS